MVVSKKPSIPNLKSNFPEPLELDFTVIEPFVLKTSVLNGQLSKFHSAIEPEDSDILKFTSSENEYAIHPCVFLSEVLKNDENIFLTNTNQFPKLINSEFFSFVHMDDSRNYYTLRVENKNIEVPAKYLGLKFYLGVLDDIIYLITDHFVDKNFNELPQVVTKLDGSLFTANSALYDEEEEWWEYTN